MSALRNSVRATRMTSAGSRLCRKSPSFCLLPGSLHPPSTFPTSWVTANARGPTATRLRSKAASSVSSNLTAPPAWLPLGVRVGSDTNGWTGEWQLPTRYLTLIGKYYSGSDLRYYFAGQLFSNYNATGGFTNLASTTSIDGASTVFFGTNAAGAPVAVPQLPVRAKGGFTQLGLPLSRWFGHDPEGRHAGWSLYLMYGTDQANTKDLIKANPGGSRARSDMSVGTLNYKLNKWVSFAYEQSLYRTRANTAKNATGVPLAFPLFEGIHQHEWRDLRSEGGVIFSF